MTDVQWMRPNHGTVPHAFGVDRLEQSTPILWPVVVACGPFERATLVEDSQSERCRLCQRAVDEVDSR